MNPSQNDRRKGATPGGIRLHFAPAWDILCDAIGNYRTNGDANQAAAISLYAILSIIPLFILTLLLVGHLFGADPGIQKKLIEGIRQFIPSFSGDLLTQFGQIEGKSELLGWAGIISLIWFSAMIFGAIETALNIIFRSKTRRNGTGGVLRRDGGADPRPAHRLRPQPGGEPHRRRQRGHPAEPPEG
jgi:uncharacterized BrkB/YihY/UPF0761 family membrane protein